MKCEKGKNGDINRYMLHEIADPEETDAGWVMAEVEVAFFREIALIAFPMWNLFQRESLDELAGDDAMAFLLKFNRVAQAEFKMWEINRYKETYRNLRSIPDLALKRILNGYKEEIGRQRGEIYEGMVASGQAHGKWISEQTAFKLVRGRYPDARYQYHVAWLGWQSLDIFIPSKSVAIEYQGKQHFEAVEFFGGEDALKDNQARDQRKRMLCAKHGVKVIDWNFDQPLTEEYFAEAVVPMIEE